MAGLYDGRVLDIMKEILFRKNLAQIIGRKKRALSFERIAVIMIWSIMPIMFCFIMCLKDSILFEDVYLANSKWNDEVFYYKMIEAVVKYGRPLGYFGYNGSTANVGQFGPWSPVLFIAYVIYGKIFGWTMLSPIYCNIVIMSIAMSVFAYLVSPTKRQTLLVYLLYGSCIPVTRYIFSNMPETTIYALLIIFLGIFIRLLTQTEDSLKISYIIWLNFLVVLLTLMRPYWVLLAIVPGAYWYYKGYRKMGILFEGILSFGCIALYFFIANNFCAPYYTEIIKLEWIKSVFDQPVLGLYGIINRFVYSLWEILQYAGDGIVNGTPVGGIYALYLTILIGCSYLSYQCFRGNKKKKLFLRYWLGYSCVMLLAIIYLYDIKVGSRHVTSFLLIFIFIISILEVSTKRIILFIACYMWIFIIRGTDEYTYQIPIYTEEKEAALQLGRRELEKGNLIELDNEEPWDNTVIWLLNDESPIDFTYLYALPGGIGIELYFKEYVLNNFADLQPKYILTNIGEEVDLLCEQESKEKIAEYGNVHIWRLR